MIDIVVPISGGKDSQACLKLAVQKHPDKTVIELFCDTKFEHPKTYIHIDRISRLYGVEIKTVSGGSVEEKCLKYGRFPGGGARHCTDELKIRETKLFCRDLASKQGGFEVWYGMRSEESSERSKRYAGKIDHDLYEPHEIIPGKYPKYLGKMGVRFKLPILSWTSQEVFSLLAGEENELYKEGFGRVGCFPCLASGDYWKEKAFNHDDFGRNQYIKIMDVSEKIKKSIWTSQEGKFRNESGQGCLICSI